MAFALEGQSSLPSDVKNVFDRVAQEALNNIAKHAGASQVQFHLIVHEEEVEVRIQDDGCGFDLAGMTLENLGLKIIGKRAKPVHAKFDIQSVPCARTQIQMHWLAGENNSLTIPNPSG